MEITKENFLNLKYNKYSDVIEIKRKENKKNFLNLINSNKLIASIIAFSIVCIVINTILIYQFFNVLCNI